MALARITTGPAGLDQRTFECETCQSVHQAFVATDPIKSRALGWLFGELRAPT